MNNYDFGKYICATTRLPCCGCSLFCEHRQLLKWDTEKYINKERNNTNETDNEERNNINGTDT
jgi:hypothetical protein